MKRMRRRVTGLTSALSLSAAALTALLISPAVLAWGPAGHMSIGFAAQPALCDAAAMQIERLGGGQSLARLGLWADSVRRQPQWRHSAPWHYVNIPDGGDPRQPPDTESGHVVSAVERFMREISDNSLDEDRRAVALRFLVHFLGDIHQPLHVGRESDRGGNMIDVSFGDEATNLHAFWDSDVIRLSGRNVRAYVVAIADAVRAASVQEQNTRIGDWVAQVFELRQAVYSFAPGTVHLDSAYVDRSVLIAERQLVLAAAHLTNTLNEAFCPIR